MGFSPDRVELPYQLDFGDDIPACRPSRARRDVACVQQTARRYNVRTSLKAAFRSTRCWANQKAKSLAVAGGRLTRAPTAVALASAGDWRQRSALRLITFAAFVEPPAPLKERALGIHQGSRPNATFLHAR